MNQQTTIGAINTATSIYSGTVIDSATGQPVSGATVTIYAGSIPVGSIAASGTGKFNLSGIADTISITSASYKPMIWPASPFQHVFELERNEETLPGVIVQSDPGPKKDNSWMLLLLLIPLLAKKKAVSGIGKIDTGTVLTVAVAGIALIGFSTIKKLFEGIGLWDSAETKQLDASTVNPSSPWNPKFWLAGPFNYGIPPLSDQQLADMLNTLTNSFGILNDDEEQAIAVFKGMRTQSQLSYFADQFSRLQLQGGIGGDLLTWLRGGVWPNDRLSDAEVNQINQYILALPKY